MPDPVRDEDLRAAAFAKVQQLRTHYGNRIPHTALMEGFTFRGQRVPLWSHMKGIYKPEILGRNGAALSLQTSADSPYEDEHDPEAGHFIYKYRGTDPDQADNRALRAAMVDRRPLIYFVAVDRGVFDAVFPVYVLGDDSARRQVTLVADQPSAALTFIDEPIAAAGRAYATRAVMVRLHQQHFRRIVLAAYRNQCAICRLKYLDLLDAAHILEDKHPRGEPIVTNGLGMCKIHHSAFDARILGIDPDARVHIRVDVLKKKDGPMLRHGLQELHGAPLVLPIKRHLRPNREFLAERFAEFNAAH
ncbi:MAG: HNH endonuclease [Gemmatimonadaceae bacterium]